MGTRLHNYKEVREYLERQHPDWLRALTPRHINAPADYWPGERLSPLDLLEGNARDKVLVKQAQRSPQHRQLTPAIDIPVQERGLGYERG